MEMPGRLAATVESTAAPSWRASAPPAGADGPVLPEGLILVNEVGGFTPDGREYVLLAGPQHRTPAPWSNVLANPAFGCLVTEAGPRCTWAGNSQSRRLTAWSNDAVADPASEAVFLHDRITDRAWSLSAFTAAVGGAISRPPRTGRHQLGACDRTLAHRDDRVGARERAGQVHRGPAAQRRANDANGHALVVRRTRPRRHTLPDGADDCDAAGSGIRHAARGEPHERALRLGRGLHGDVRRAPRRRRRSHRLHRTQPIGRPRRRHRGHDDRARRGRTRCLRRRAGRAHPGPGRIARRRLRDGPCRQCRGSQGAGGAIPRTRRDGHRTRRDIGRPGTAGSRRFESARPIPRSTCS